jgi:hypothetical protein
MLKKKVYSGIATNVVVRSGSKDLCVTCKSLKKKKKTLFNCPYGNTK